MKKCFSYKVQKANLGSGYIVRQQLKVNEGEGEDGGAAGYENHGILFDCHVRIDEVYQYKRYTTLYPK